jgi:YD repeat-containing protein
MPSRQSAVCHYNNRGRLLGSIHQPHRHATGRDTHHSTNLETLPLLQKMVEQRIIQSKEG